MDVIRHGVADSRVRSPREQTRVEGGRFTVDTSRIVFHAPDERRRWLRRLRSGTLALVRLRRR